VTFEKITGSDCYCGTCIIGREYDIGDTRYGAQTGIEDYSRKLTDDSFGYTYLKQGNFKKTLEVDLHVSKSQVNTVNNVLTQLRATPTVWTANQNDTEYDSLIVYGFIKDFSIIYESVNHMECNLEIEGLI
jgi:hypothetical protein